MNKLIGNTPMIKIKYKYNDKIKYIYTKLEHYNLTGSIKDRMAYYIIDKAKLDNSLKDNMPIIEATSGNTGISLAAIGAYYKHPVYIFMPDWTSEERVKLMKMYGANVKLFSKEDGGFKRCIEEAKKLSKEINGFLTNQFSNQINVLGHYNTTGKEIVDKIDKIDGFVSGIGTGGTLMGVAKRLKENNSDVCITALEPDKMAIMSEGEMIGHKIEGIGDDFIPDIVNRKSIDKIYLINDEDAINMSRKLALDLGIGVGISSGCNFLGAILLNEDINGNIVTIFPDDNKKYLSTDLSNKKNDNTCMISNNVELIDYEIL